MPDLDQIEQFLSRLQTQKGFSGNTLVAYRKSWFEEVGYSKFPETWEEYRDAGKKLKAKGHPIGQTLGHTFGDAPTYAYPYLWSWGGKEVEQDGNTVVLDSKATVDSVKFMTGFWKDAHDEGGTVLPRTLPDARRPRGAVAPRVEPPRAHLEEHRHGR